MMFVVREVAVGGDDEQVSPPHRRGRVDGLQNDALPERIGRSQLAIFGERLGHLTTSGPEIMRSSRSSTVTEKA
ncbi:hypothetical protein [Nonomuraea rubra]|uniref:Uncharacterized protein n=1 Tax=Nonomuraea rubra TaxID=46180 RepID=A0A7X0U2I2_9ACTN|nr:hypothetical protein [Nonomuraea rubra]MBB6552658.1 hypothetical protein [Nonomuraea rubra]